MMLPATWKRAVLHSKAASVASVVVVCRGTWRKGAETTIIEHRVSQFLHWQPIRSPAPTRVALKSKNKVATKLKIILMNGV